MGAESHCGWIRTGTEKDYDWLDDSCLPGIFDGYDLVVEVAY